MSLQALFVESSPPGQVLSWGNAKLFGQYTLIAGTNYTVLAPNGDTPTEGAPASHRYHHHTRVGVGAGRVWVSFSSSGTNEDASGQMTLVCSTADGGANWSAPQVLVPAQSAWTGTGAAYVNGSLISYAGPFVTYLGNLYAVGAIDEVGPSGANDLTGRALAAALCNSNGTLGTAFRISTETYAGVDYDAVLGPPLFVLANLYGRWGGSSPSNTASTWIGWKAQHNHTFAEPSKINLDAGATSFVRLWRKITGSGTAFLWADDGTAEGLLRQTDIPNQPSAPAGIRLTDGRIVTVTNCRDVSTVRDPLCIAVYPSGGGVATLVNAVRQGLTGTPTYAGTFKAGGAAYPDLVQDGDDLWISYSMQKETIGATKISISGALP